LAHREPMSHVARSRATPKLAAIDLGDEAEELTLDPGSFLMRLIDRIDQVYVAVCVCWGHRDLVRSRGRTTHAIEHTFDSQAFRLFPSLDLAGRAVVDRLGCQIQSLRDVARHQVTTLSNVRSRPRNTRSCNL